MSSKDFFNARATAFTFWVIIQAARFSFFKFSVFLPHRQRGQPKVEKGEGQTKPDKNRHSLPLFPLRFSPLDSPFLNPLFPLLCRFLPASLSVAQERTNPYQPVAASCASLTAYRIVARFTRLLCRTIILAVAIHTFL